MSLTFPGAQWATDKSVAIPIQPVTLYQNAAGRWIATTRAADAIGYTTGLLVASSGKLVIDTTVSTGLRAVIAPRSLLAYS